MNSLQPYLACPACKSDLVVEGDHFNCADCGAVACSRGNTVDFLGVTAAQDLTRNPDGKAMVQQYRKPNPVLAAIRRVVSSEYFPGKAWRQAKQRVFDEGERTLVVGSGVTRFENAIHLDIDDFPGVDLVADAHQLPLKSNSVTGVLCEVVLEHLAHPQQVIAEAYRVLQPGGRVFFIAPFVFPFHGQPNDFHRWSVEGLKVAFADFASLEVGIHGGPCSAMVHLLSEWCYILSGLRFPRGYLPIKGLATALLFPFKYLDFWVYRFPEAHRLASTLYVTGKKA